MSIAERFSVIPLLGILNLEKFKTSFGKSTISCPKAEVKIKAYPWNAVINYPELGGRAIQSCQPHGKHFLCRGKSGRVFSFVCFQNLRYLGRRNENNMTSKREKCGL